MVDEALASMHLKNALAATQTMEVKMQALRDELYLAGQRVLNAEANRDMIRAHAQAALDKYRARSEAVLAALSHLRSALGEYHDTDDILCAITLLELH